MSDKCQLRVVTDEHKLKYLKELAQHGAHGRAALASGASYNAFLHHRKRDLAFDEAVKFALRLFGEGLEKEAYRRGVEGLVKPRYWQGVRVDKGEEREYSDRMLEMLLKKNVPEFREKVTIDTNIRGGVLVVNASAKDVNEWLEKHGGEKK